MTERERKAAYAWDHIRQAGSAFAMRGDSLLPGYRELKKLGLVTIDGSHVQLAGAFRRAFLAGEQLPSWDTLFTEGSTVAHSTAKPPSVLQLLKGYKARVRFEDQQKRFGQYREQDRPRWTAFVQDAFGYDAVGEGATKEAAARAAVSELPQHIRRHFETAQGAMP